MRVFKLSQIAGNGPINGVGSNIKYLSFLTLVTLFAACNSENSRPTEISLHESLLGSWVMMCKPKVTASGTIYGTELMKFNCESLQSTINVYAEADCHGPPVETFVVTSKYKVNGSRKLSTGENSLLLTITQTSRTEVPGIDKWKDIVHIDGNTLFFGTLSPNSQYPKMLDLEHYFKRM